VAPPWIRRGAAPCVALRSLGLGGHLGVETSGNLAGVQILVRTEISLGTSGYVPAFFGPLYQYKRAKELGPSGSDMLLDAEMGRGGGLGGAVSAELASTDLFSARGGMLWRPGAGRTVWGGVNLAYRRPLLFAFAGGLDLDGGEFAPLGAAEARLSLPGGLFFAVDGARLFRRSESGAAPVWTVSALVGGGLGAN
jgi:hypothetical protein